MVMCKALPHFPAGSTVRIERLCECPKARGRLCALGLTPGTTVQVCSGGPGPCRLKVRGGSVAIGQGMASGVYCSYAPPDAEQNDPARTIGEQNPDVHH